MSRLSKFLFVAALVVFALACNLVTQPINDVQNLAGTAEAIATSMPVETLQALSSAVPTFQALASAIPDFGKYFDPQGTPSTEWNGIPIMPQATAGQEFNEKTYSFKANVKVQEVYDFYNEKLASLGWSQSMSMPVTDAGGLLAFSKDDAVLTITIASSENSTVVLLNLG
jgi:hypothetical protein